MYVSRRFRVALLVMLSTLCVVAVSAQNRVTQGDISPGQNRQASLRDGQEHVWRLQLSQDQQITIDLERIDSSIDPYLELLTATGSEIETDDDGGSGRDSFISRFLSAGEYQIIAREFGRDDSGDYRLTVRATNVGQAPQSSGGIPIQIGQTVDSYISNGQSQIFVLEISEAQRVRIDHMSSDNSDIDPYLHLRDAFDNDIETDDDGGSGFNSRIERFLQPGTYRIAARDLGRNDSGAFRLSVSSLAGGQSLQGIPVRLGQTLTVFINEGQEQGFLLQLSESTALTISLDRGSEGSIDPYLELYDSQGNSVASDDDGGSGYNSRISRTLSPGQYLIVGRDLGNNSAGSLEISVLPGNSLTEAIPIRLGQTLTVFINEGQEQGFLLQLSESTAVTISLDSGSEGNIDPYLELYDDQGNRIDYDDDGGSGFNSQIARTLSPGVYQLVARDLGNNSAGSLEISVVAGSLANAIPIRPGQSYDGYLNSGQSFIYRLDLPSQRSVTIEFIRTNNAGFDPMLTLRRASGEQIASDDDGGSGLDSRLQRTLDAGSYLIEVRDRLGNRSGSYRIIVN